jgi:glucose-1-phosphate cytidylyltransferase
MKSDLYGSGIKEVTLKVVILAGGFGTRISEESHLTPKPMIEIGGQPMLWHIMKIYSYYGFNDFVICCGYKANVIKEYFANYYLYASDVNFNFRENGRMEIHSNSAEPWSVTVVDTGLNTMTGGRIKRIEKYIGEKSFLLTYGDGVSNIDIAAEVKFHCEHGQLITVAAVQPSGKFGAVHISDDGNIDTFKEKPRGDGGWINGGFFVCEPGVFGYLGGDDTVWEREPLERIANEGKLYAYRHGGFWQNMDTLHDKNLLEELWQSGKAPWKIW